MLRLQPECRAIDEFSEREVFRALEHHVRPGDTVLDVGANVGVYTMLLARWIAPSGRVHAFEPAPDAFRLLTDHLALNGLSHAAVVTRAAVGDDIGRVQFRTVGAGGLGHTVAVPLHHATVGSDIIEVAATTIDAYCAEHDLRPDLIKVDVEGAEMNVLRGAARTLIEHRPIVVVEVHPDALRSRGVTEATFCEFLASVEYSFSALEHQQRPIDELGHLLLEPLGPRMCRSGRVETDKIARKGATEH